MRIWKREINVSEDINIAIVSLKFTWDFLRHKLLSPYLDLVELWSEQSNRLNTFQSSNLVEETCFWIHFFYCTLAWPFQCMLETPIPMRLRSNHTHRLCPNISCVQCNSNRSKWLLEVPENNWNFIIKIRKEIITQNSHESIEYRSVTHSNNCRIVWLDKLATELKNYSRMDNLPLPYFRKRRTNNLPSKKE